MIRQCEPCPGETPRFSAVLAEYRATHRRLRGVLAFFKTLESHEALSENAMLMVDVDSEFFRYLQTTSP